MFVLRMLVKLVKLINSETSSASLAAAFAIGMFLGLVPLLTLQAALAILVVMFFRVNITVALFSFAVFKLAAMAGANSFHAMGASLLERPGLAGLWTWLYNNPLLSLCGTNHSITLGATIVATLLFVPLFFMMRLLVDRYRDRVSDRISKLGVVNAVRGTKIYKLFQWVDSPF